MCVALQSNVPKNSKNCSLTLNFSCFFFFFAKTIKMNQQDLLRLAVPSQCSQKNPKVDLKKGGCLAIQKFRNKCRTVYELDLWQMLCEWCQASESVANNLLFCANPVKIFCPRKGLHCRHRWRALDLQIVLSRRNL